MTLNKFVNEVTNDFGIEWMRRHLGDKYTIHVLDFQDKNAMHIDGTFIPLGSCLTRSISS